MRNLLELLLIVTILTSARAAQARFVCSSPAGSYPEVCDVGSSMPIYDQSNPNFATVSVPNDIYCSELRPSQGTAGQLCRDASGNYCTGGSGCKPYGIVLGGIYGFDTWLPKGAIAGDPEYQWDWSSDSWVVGTASGGASTDFCGATTGAMIIAASLNNRSSSTLVLAGSWVQTYFQPDATTGVVADANPDVRKTMPDPLFDASGKSGYGSDVRACTSTGAHCMSRNGLQRVINYNILRSVDPTDVSGSNDGQGLSSLVNDFYPAATYVHGSDITFGTMRSLVRGGNIVHMRHTKYFVSVAATTCPSNLAGDTCYEVTATKDPNNGGHYEALRGYSLDASGNYEFFFNNPFYGYQETLPGNATGGLRHITLDTYYNCGNGVHKKLLGSGDLPSGQTDVFIWPDAKADASRLCDYQSNNSTYIVTNYEGLLVP